MDSQVAAKAVIQNPEGKFLIVRHNNRWEAVGGRLEKSELLEDGLRRETEEETGIKELEILKAIHVGEWFAKPEGELKHIVAIFFLCKVGSDKITLSQEHQEFAWVAADELDGYGDSLEKEIHEAIIIANREIDF